MKGPEDMELLLQNKNLQIENLKLQLLLEKRDHQDETRRLLQELATVKVNINTLKRNTVDSDDDAEESGEASEVEIEDVLELDDELEQERSTSPSKQSASASSELQPRPEPQSTAPSTPMTRSRASSIRDERSKRVHSDAAAGCRKTGTKASGFCATRKSCSEEGCQKQAKVRGLCCKHGGSTRCSLKGCTNNSRVKGLCWVHGGKLTCKADGCNRSPKSGGYCCSHKMEK